MRKILALAIVLCLAVPVSAGLVSDDSSADEGLPAFYFLPDSYATSEIRDQGQWGTCYTFSTLGAVESLLYKDGLYLDLSELYLASSVYIDGEDGSIGFNGEYNPYQGGGDIGLCLQLLSSGYGSALESDVPYSDISSDYVHPDGISPVLYVTGFSSFDATEDAVLIKERIASGDLICAGINADYYCPKYTLQNGRACNPFAYSEKAPDHAVLLAGWDDTVPGSTFGPDTPGDGAWIIKNSWGEENDWGYCLVSYYSTVKLVKSVDSYILADGSVNLYEHDYIPGVLTVEASTAANMFTAQDYETLESVSFEVDMKDFDYIISVYAGCSDGDPVSGGLASTTSGHCSRGVLVSVELDEPVDLRAGEPFSVVVTIKGDDPKFVLEDSYIEEGIDMVLTAVSEPGQSFVFNDGDWTDISASGHSNLRIKAYTTDRDVSVSSVVFLAAAALAAIIVAGVAVACYQASLKGRD